MSELFDEESRETPQPRGSRRSRALVITAVVLVLLFLGLSSFARPGWTATATPSPRSAPGC
jgi:hypothetical protein